MIIADGTQALDPELRGRVLAALRARRQGGLVAAVAPLLDQQAWMLTQEMELDHAKADRVLQAQHAILDVLAARFDALDEAVVRSGIPFAEIGGDGRIVYANAAFADLVPSPEGRAFSPLFGARAPHVDAALQAGTNTSLRLNVQAEGVALQVRLEVGPLRDEEGRPGGYALMLDQSAERSRLNALQDGVLRTDLEGHVSFANDRATETLGYTGAEVSGLSLGLLLLPEQEGEPDPVPRWLAEGDGFSAVIRLRLRDGRTVPARVSGAPYIEEANRSAGLQLMFAPLVEDLARQELQRILLEEADPHRIIEAALAAIGTVIPFDLALFGIYDDQCSWWRALSIVPKPDWAWSTRWFPINAQTRAWLEKGQTWVNDLARWVESITPGGDIDPVTQAVLDREFTSMLVLPIREVGGFRSAVSLLSKSRDYSGKDLRALQNLGVEEVLQAADAALERARARAKRTMRDELNQAPTTRLLAERLARGAVRIFGWDYAGVFRVDREKQVFTLIAEDAADRTLLVRPDPREQYYQALGTGMLGKCLDRKAVLIVNDVDGTGETHGFIRTAPGQQSATTVPLFLNGRIEMILDLESAERNAFVGPDQEEARGLAADCEQIFAARWRQVIESALMDRIEQAAVIVDAGGMISDLNNAALMMLGKAQGQMLDMFGAHPADRALLKRSGPDLQPRVELVLSVSAGTGLPPAEVATWAERTPLLDDYGYQLWLFTSQAEQRRASDWAYLEETVTSVAQQTRAPLLIADGLLRGALSLVQQPKLMEEGVLLLKQAANALLKADLTFERLSERMTIRQPPTGAPAPFNLRAVLEYEAEALCRTDEVSDASERVIVVVDEVPSEVGLMLTGWPYRLAFAFRSAMGSLLLQRVAPDDRIVVTLAMDGPARVTLHMAVAGTPAAPSEAAAPMEASRAEARRLTQMAGEAIAAAVTQHGGTMRESDGTTYVLTLPLNAAKGAQ